MTARARTFFSLAAIGGAALIAVACANTEGDPDPSRLAIASLGLLAAAVMLEIALR